MNLSKLHLKVSFKKVVKGQIQFSISIKPAFLEENAQQNITSIEEKNHLPFEATKDCCTLLYGDSASGDLKLHYFLVPMLLEITN